MKRPPFNKIHEFNFYLLDMLSYDRMNKEKQNNPDGKKQRFCKSKDWNKLLFPRLFEDENY